MSLLKSIERAKTLFASGLKTGAEGLAAVANRGLQRAEHSAMKINSRGRRLVRPGEYDNLFEEVRQSLAPRFQQFLDDPNKGYWGGKVQIRSATKTLQGVGSFKQMPTTAEVEKSIIDPILQNAKFNYQLDKARRELAPKRAKMLLSSKDDIQPGENPIRQVRMDSDPRRINQDYAQLMGNKGPVVNSNSGFLGDLADYKGLMNAKPVEQMRTGQHVVRPIPARMNPTTQLNSNAGQISFAAAPNLRGKIKSNRNAPQLSSEEIWRRRGKIALGIGTSLGPVALAGVGAAQLGSDLMASSPPQLAMSGPTAGFGEEDRLGNPSYSSSQAYMDPMTYRTVGPMTPDRLGATGQLPLALHKMRRR